ncbi:MAG: hypothetical protein KGP28_12010 [Bdellovibrionales bacterium]|nr:hypothetical protein [Bdellovibrionales bacterium]
MDAKGQSILEIVVVLPFLFILVGLLFRLNLALQMAINNVQYSRSQLYVLTGNSPEYPRLSFRHKREGAAGRTFVEREQDLMVLGVSDPRALTEDEGEGSMPAIPQKQRITRAGVAGGSEEAGEQEKRTNVRVRETSAICTQMNSVSKTVNFDSFGVVGLKNQSWPFKKLVCQYEKKWIGDYDEQ